MAKSRGNLAALAAYITALRLVGKGGVKRVSRAVSEEAKMLVDEGFARGISPAGAAWAPLQVRAGQPLRDTRRLQSSLAPVDTGRGFRISTNVSYAAVHQYGATIRAKGKHGLYSPKLKAHFGKKVKIPARPFLPRDGKLPSRWSKGLDEAAKEAIALLLKKRGR